MPAPGKDRIPPHNDDAERAVIGAMLIDDSVIGMVGQYLTPDDFYSSRNRKIYEAILSLFSRATKPDLITLSGELEKNGKLEEAGGVDYIASLTHVVPSSANAEYYSQNVQNDSMRRALIRISGEIGARAFDEMVEPKLILEEAQQKLFSISDPSRIYRYKKMENVVGPVFSYLDEVHKNKTEFTGIPSGFYDLDKLTLGFQPAELIIIGARPGMGKTAIALSMAVNVAVKQNKPVAFFSLEMSDRALMMRLFSAEAGVESNRLRKGNFSQSEKANIFHAAEHLHDAPLYIVDSPHMTILNIQAMSRMLKIQENVEIVFIDYIGLIDSDGKFAQRFDFISHVSRSLKGLARELNIPVVALSQLRREAEKGKPSLADIRESGSIEQDADVVMLLDKDRQKEIDKSFDEQSNEIGQKVKLLLAKNRNGPVGTIDLTFMKHLTKFVSYTDEKT